AKELCVGYLVVMGILIARVDNSDIEDKCFDSPTDQLGYVISPLGTTVKSMSETCEITSLPIAAQIFGNAGLELSK
ncbi:7_t:CDS:1, partial [Dentiscutata heterogama]